MANHVTNRIGIVGNESADALMVSIIKALNVDRITSKEHIDTSSLQRVLTSSLMHQFFFDFDEEEMGAKWAYPDGPLDEREDLRIISAWDPIVGLQNYLLLCVSEVDPTAVVQMEYDDEMPNFCGFRLILNNNGKIVQFSEQMDTESVKVVMDDELEEAEEENAESEEFEEVITWEEFWTRLSDLKIRVIEDAIKRGPSAHKATLERLL